MNVLEKRELVESYNSVKRNDVITYYVLHNNILCPRLDSLPAGRQGTSFQ